MALIFNDAEQKEKLPDVEIQAKKAEVAQRRKMQVEKAEREQQVCFLLVDCILFSFFWAPILLSFYCTG